jgi:hypothetical protein
MIPQDDRRVRKWRRLNGAKFFTDDAKDYAVEARGVESCRAMRPLRVREQGGIARGPRRMCRTPGFLETSSDLVVDTRDRSRA